MNNANIAQELVDAIGLNPSEHFDYEVPPIIVSCRHDIHRDDYAKLSPEAKTWLEDAGRRDAAEDYPTLPELDCSGIGCDSYDEEDDS